ncbi:hypothetical protein BJX70DRAFT_375023 [Aspergillus crustosus]
MVYTHAHPYTPLLTLLSTQLPYSGPLLRRIQYAVSNPSPTGTGYVLASFPEDAVPVTNPSSTPSPGLDSDSDSDSDSNPPWLASYVDVNRGPDTQVWIYSSLESASSNKNGLSTTEDSQGNALGHFDPGVTSQKKEVVKSQLLDLFTYTRKTLIPPYLDWLASKQSVSAQSPVPGAVAVAVKDQGVPKIPTHRPTSILLGTIHIGLVALIVEIQAESKSKSEPESESRKPKPKLKIHRGEKVFYVKYCFPAEAFDISTAVLERSAENQKSNADANETGSFRFHDSNGNYGIQETHIDLVTSRTNIPRSKEALLAMGGVALFHDAPDSAPEKPNHGEEELPIAWAFLGFDGSLCSLHVEPEFRGRGLAAIVGREVMKNGVGRFETGTVKLKQANGEKEKEWFFADVAVENLASRRVMEKMGGLVGWTISWMVVEVFPEGS